MQRNSRNEAGKLFIGGLSWGTTQESLMGYFSKYGEVIDCVVMKNSETGKSRGFGFVTYKDPNCVETVLSVPCHIIDGRQVDAKACNPKSMNRAVKGPDPDKGKKIFIGGLPNIDEEGLKMFFSRYGKVLDVTIMYDQNLKRSRGFGFLTFESESSVDEVCAEHYVQINGKKVECKPAEPRDGKQGAFGMDKGRQISQMIHELAPIPQHDDGNGNWPAVTGAWNQGGPPPQVTMAGGFQGLPPGAIPQQQPPPQQPPPQQQPGFNPAGFQGQPSYQGAYQQPPAWSQQPGSSPGQGTWTVSQPNPPPPVAPPQGPPSLPSPTAYGGQPPPAGYAQPAPGANGYPQWGGQPPTPTQQQPPAVAAPPQQPPAQPGYPAYAPQPATAPGNPQYAAPGQPGTPQAGAPPPRPYGDYGPVIPDAGQPPAQPTPAAAPPAAAYASYAAYAQAAAPAGVPDPYAQAQQPQPGAPQPAPAGYGGTPPGPGAPPPEVAQPKPTEYAAYSYGAYGYGDAAAAAATFGGIPPPAQAYGGQGDAQQPAYAAPPAGSYQRPGAAQAYHPYRR